MLLTLTPDCITGPTFSVIANLFSVAAGYADAYQSEVRSTTSGAGFGQSQSFARRIAAGVSSQTLDMTAGMLPVLLTAATTNATSARPVLTWTASASLAATDAGVVTLLFDQVDDAGVTEPIDWTFIVPPGTLTVTAPQLPASLSAFTPSATSVLQAPRAVFVESDLIPGYDAVRAAASSFGLSTVPTRFFFSGTLPALPANGTLRTTAVTANN